MERVYERCGALDVHKQQVTVCVHVPDRRGERSELRAEFGTMTGDLLGLRGWLKGLGVTHVAMEATGVYWKPVYYLLEGDFELLLVNAQHVKNVPGKDGRAGRPVALPAARARPVEVELRAALADPRTARPDPLSRVAELGARPRGQPAADGARGRQHQARLGGEPSARRLGQGDAEGALRGRVRPGGTGRPRQGASCERSCRRSGPRSRDASGRTAPCSSRTCSPTSSTSTRRSRSSPPRSRSGWAPSSANVSCSARSPASPSGPPR